ncbi:MAG TPA: PIG-L family deacetylase [Chloroflexota bacterium]|nr:PIG-L family deacetylase [Chloroflexota bacterium]
MLPRRCLVAIHAHPDDESILTGGLLARCHAQGIRTVVVTCTGGEAGDARGAIAGSLAAARQAELRQALAVLGVSRATQLPYRDSGMAGWPTNTQPGTFHMAPLAEAASRVQAVLQEEQPDLVITYDAAGGYGHPDHVKAHRVAEAAFRACHLGTSRLAAVVFPASWLVRFAQLARSAGVQAQPSALLGIDDLPGEQPSGLPDTVAGEALDTLAFVGQKRRAITAHASQMSPDHALMRLPPEIHTAIWSREFYLTLELRPASHWRPSADPLSL